MPVPMNEEKIAKIFVTASIPELCKRLDPLVTAWNARPLRDTRYPFVLLDATPKSIAHARLTTMLHASDMEMGRQLEQQILNDFAKKAPKAKAMLESGFEDAMAVMVLPEAYRQRLRTTNCVERTNEEIRRHERVIRIFLNWES